eukprot:354792-Chlamydomonas_euryale.AAC.3
MVWRCGGGTRVRSHHGREFGKGGGCSRASWVRGGEGRYMRERVIVRRGRGGGRCGSAPGEKEE